MVYGSTTQYLTSHRDDIITRLVRKFNCERLTEMVAISLQQRLGSFFYCKPREIWLAIFLLDCYFCLSRSNYQQRSLCNRNTGRDCYEREVQELKKLYKLAK